MAPDDDAANRYRHVRNQVVELAERIGKPVFDGVVEELEARCHGKGSLRDARTAMANHHYWCSAFAAIARGVERFGDAQAEVAALARGEVATAVAAFLRPEPPLLMRTAGDLLVDGVCQALGDPALAAIGSPETVRALRILAVFCCPAPERHPDVVRYCVRPLAHEVLVPGTEERLTLAFGPDVVPA